MTDIDAVRQRLELLEDEELASILRDRDEETWRPEVFDIVASILHQRGIRPGESGESQQDAGGEGARDLVTAAQYASSLDANADCEALEAAGINAWLVDGSPDAAEGAIQGVTLQVRAADLIAAKAILESDVVPSSALPPEIAEPPCPRCNSREVRESAEIAEVLDYSTGSTEPSERQLWLYHCASCGYKWSG